METIAGNCILIGRKGPPDACRAGDRLYAGRKGLDHHGAVIAHCIERCRRTFPIDLPTARRAPVAFTGVDVEKMLPCKLERGGHIFFFDVHVESIEVNADVRVIDFFDKIDCLPGRVEHIRFKAVDQCTSGSRLWRSRGFPDQRWTNRVRL